MVSRRFWDSVDFAVEVVLQPRGVEQKFVWRLKGLLIISLLKSLDQERVE